MPIVTRGSLITCIDPARNSLTSETRQMVKEDPGCAPRHPGLRDPARLARHEQAHQRYVDEVLHPPDRRYASYAAVTAVLVSILVGGFMFAPLPKTGERDCQAKAGPGVDWNGCSFDSLVAPGVNLAGANLRNVSLRGADLFGARLKQADASYAILAGSFLRGADIQQTTLVGANLQRADLSFSSLREADLSYADLTGAQLTGADLRGARLGHTIWVDGRVCAELSVGRCLVVNSRG